MTIVEIGVNCPTKESAERIANHLVSQRLAACANIHPAIDSRYRWKGRVETEPEVPLLIKTRASLGDRVEAAIRDLHPYETPGIIRIAIDGANDDYAAWVHAETVDP